MTPDDGPLQAPGGGIATAEEVVSPAAQGRRRTLDTNRILRAGVDFIDQNGLGQLTMRRLGAHLGVEAMALYRYVPGREQLLDGVVEVLMDELYRDTLGADTAQNWPEYLQLLAHRVRQLATEHPRVFPLVATRPPAAPWLRPPLRSLRWVESFLMGLKHYGFSPSASVVVYRSFATFLLGHLLFEASTLEGALEMGHGDIEVRESSDLSDYPLVQSLSEELSKTGYDNEFEESLEDLINRLAPLLE